MGISETKVIDCSVLYLRNIRKRICLILYSNTNFSTSIGYPTVQLSSDTNYPEIVKTPQVRPILLQTPAASEIPRFPSLLRLP